ncbi:hypothetical protein H1R20_g1756, partial [Candolleomyces eurysporus]
MTNNAYEDILLPDVDLFNIDSVKAFNEARQKRISAGDKNPPPEAIFRERLQTPPPKDRQAKDHEIIAGFLSATPNTRRRALNDLIKKQKEDGLWEEEGDRSITVSDDESDEEVRRQLGDSDKDQNASLIPLSKKLLTASDLQDFNPSKHGGLIIPSVMQNLVIVRQHIPMSLFLPESLERFRSNRVKFISDYPASRSKDTTTEKKIKIPDVKDFPDEANLSALQWTQALPNYKKFLRQVADDAVCKIFKRHFDALQSELDFESNFPAMLAMDILFRSKFYESLVRFNEVQWDKDLAQCRAMQIRKDLSQANSASSAYRQDSRFNRRFAPYPQPRQPTSSASFHDPLSASSVSERTLTKNALKRIRRKANRRSQLPKEDNSSNEVVTDVQSAQVSTSVVDVHSEDIVPMTHLTSAPSVVAPRIMPVAGTNTVPPTNQPDSSSLADDDLSIIAASFASSLSLDSLASSASQKLLLATHSDSSHTFSATIQSFINLLSFRASFVKSDRFPYNVLQSVEMSPYDSNEVYSRIITPYSAEAFRIFLEAAGIHHMYPYLSHKITHGFSLGNLTSIDVSFTPDNLRSALPHSTVINEYIQEEIRLNRFSGPFTQEELERITGPFRSSPLQIVTKQGPPWFFSQAPNSDDFPTCWGTPDECAFLVAIAPPGAQACTLDIEGAYRTIPVRPDHKRFLIIKHKGLFYLNHDVPFGLRNASGLQGEVADAIVDIWHSLGVGPVIKWVL